MYEEWFQRRPALEPVEWTPDSAEATHLHAYLNHQIAADVAASKLILPSSAEEDVSEKQWRLWNLVLDVAAELPETHADLVALLRAFRTLEDPGDWAVDWRALGSFGSVWRDAWESFFTRRLNPPPPPTLPSHPHRWLTINSFSALLASHNLAPISPVFGFFLLRDSLEEPLPTAALAVDPPAAAQWILRAGPRLFATENVDVDRCWERGLAAETALWKGAGGFSRARWGFWRARLEALGGGEGEGGMEEGEGKAVVREAAGRMREIEEGGRGG